MAPRTPKVTRLEDNAEIYKQREFKTEREKLRELDFHGKVEYFNSYYLPKLIAAIVIIGMVVWILITVFRPKKEEVLNIAMSNYPIAPEDIDQITSDMNEILEVDPENQVIFIDTGYDMLNEDAASLQKFSTFMCAGDIDILIAPESVVRKYAFLGSLLSLDEALSTEFVSSLAHTPEQLLKCKTKLKDEVYPEDAQGPEDFYGIYIQNHPIFKAFTKESIEKDPPVIAVIGNTDHESNCEKLIQYLLDQSK